MTIQVLKALVVGMAVLIVAGVTVIVVTIANRMAAPSGTPAGRGGAIALEVPAGSTVAETVADGDRLVLRLETPEGPRIVVVDLRDGTVAATISLVPAP
jgi:hypothetical protein